MSVRWCAPVGSALITPSAVPHPRQAMAWCCSAVHLERVRAALLDKERRYSSARPSVDLDRRVADREGGGLHRVGAAA